MSLCGSVCLGVCVWTAIAERREWQTSINKSFSLYESHVVSLNLGSSLLLLLQSRALISPAVTVNVLDGCTGGLITHSG